MKHFLPEELIAKYLSDDLTTSEERELFAWVEADKGNKKFFEEVVKIWSLSNEDEDFQTDTILAWRKIERGIEKRDKAPVVRSMPKRATWWRVAAAMLLLVMAGWWLMLDKGEMKEVIALGGEVKEVVLPDGSHIWLNENSRLSYTDDFSPRTLELSGEAFFEVARDEQHPFTILSESATIQVLGTSFNVKAYQQVDSVVVTVKTGKVAVENRKVAENGVVLTPGEVGVVYKKQSKVKKVNNTDENFMAWKTKELFFDQIPLREVIKSIEAYFGVKVVVENPAILNCKYQGRFEQPKLEDILDAMVFSMELSVEKSDDKVIIKGNGCK